VNPLRRKLTEAIALTGMRPPLRIPSTSRIPLRGKRVLITGASSGIGEAGAERFAREGAEVIAVARRADLLEALSERIGKAGGTASPIPCDLSDLDAVDELADTVATRFGGVDILVNNAGRSIRRPLADSLDRWHDV
jgi:NAD(P)-dependent dehydrogenase (short-subunit alcohol dehydrogenase family)